MTLELTEPVTEMSKRILPGGIQLLVLKANNFTAICGPILRKMWEPTDLHSLLQE
jgi:hypothetical protein